MLYIEVTGSQSIADKNDSPDWLASVGRCRARCDPEKADHTRP